MSSDAVTTRAVGAADPANLEDRDLEPDGAQSASHVEPPAGALARLKQHLPYLKGTSQRVGGFVVENPWEARGLSINDLADRVGVSVNSVVRLTRELGFKGY